MGLIVDESGKPITGAQIVPQRERMQQGAGPFPGTPLTTQNTSYAFPYEASQWSTQEMSFWYPAIRSPDAEIDIYRDRMVARARDLSRNDGWIHGAVNRILDSTIGINILA